MKIIVQETENGNMWNITMSEPEVGTAVIDYAAVVAKAMGVSVLQIMAAFSRVPPDEIKQLCPEFPQFLYEVLKARWNTNRSMKDQVNCLVDLLNELSKRTEKQG